MHGPPWCLLLCALFQWHEKWAELAHWSLQAGSWQKSGLWIFFHSFWWLIRKLRREERTHSLTLALSYLTRSCIQMMWESIKGEIQTPLSPFYLLLATQRRMKKEQAQCWQKVSVLEVLFSTAATKSGLPPSTQKNYKRWRWVVSFHWLLSDQECAKSNCFFSSGIQKRVLSWLAMLCIVSAQAVLSSLLHVHTLHEERLWWDIPYGNTTHRLVSLHCCLEWCVCVWATNLLQHTSHFYPLNKLLQVLYWTKVMFLTNLGYPQPILHCEQFCSSWYPIQHQSWLPWLVQGCLIRFLCCSPSCCPETLHNVLLCTPFPCSHGHCSLNQQRKLHLSEVPRVPANSQQHNTCREFSNLFFKVLLWRKVRKGFPRASMQGRETAVRCALFLMWQKPASQPLGFHSAPERHVKPHAHT